MSAYETSQSLLEESTDELKTLVGEIRSITFANDDNGWTVARIRARGEPGLVTVVGNLFNPTPGEVLEMRGSWKDHPKFGRQFVAESFVQTYPATENGIIRYLASGLIKGVGKRMAERLVESLGKDVLYYLDNDPEKLLTIEGIGRKKLDGILESWNAQREIRSLMLFLQTHEIPTTYAARIYKIYGDTAIAKLEENPFELTYMIRGIGFKTARKMASKLGIPDDSPQTVEAAIVYSLLTLSERGHLFAPEADLVKEVRVHTECLIPEDVFENAMSVLLERKKIHVEDLEAQCVRRAVYLKHFHRYETETATRLANLVGHPCPSATRKKVEKNLPDLERQAGITLSNEQREAVVGACDNKAFIITGGPGTGKTTITRMIVQSLDEAGLSLKLAAPTGRAAKRMSEAAGMDAHTIHRLLQYSPAEGFQVNEENKLKTDVVIVDEASMLDAHLFVSLLRAIPITARLVLVGDVNQLPSVGPGNVLGDLIESATIGCAVLTHIYRQAMESYIVRNAHNVNAGEYPGEDPRSKPPEKDFWWVQQDDPQKAQEIIRQLVCERIPKVYGFDPLKDIQVLAPMHKGEVGTQALNALLQDSVNSSPRELVRGYQRLRVGDRVLQLRNNYDKEVFNGDLGWVVDVDSESVTAAVDFDGREVEYDITDLDELTLAYAISVHKSQGSEYPVAIIPMVSQHYVMLQRNLLYTALTRAKKLAVLVGGKRSIGIALNNNKAGKRNTHLRYRLQEIF